MENLKAWRAGEKFFREQLISFSMRDRNGHAKALEIMRMFGEMAGDDFRERGLPHHRILEGGYYFVLTRASVHLHRHPLDSEPVTVSTWPHMIKSLQVARNFRIEGADGLPICSGQEMYVIISRENHRPIRVKDFPLTQIGVDDDAVPCLPAKRIRLSEEATDVSTVTATFSVLDANGHVNNSYYPTFAYDALPEDLQNIGWTDMQVEFDEETKLGETLRIMREDPAHEEPGWVTMAAYKENGDLGFGCRFRFDEGD